MPHVFGRSAGPPGCTPPLPSSALQPAPEQRAAQAGRHRSLHHLQPVPLRLLFGVYETLIPFVQEGPEASIHRRAARLAAALPGQQALQHRGCCCHRSRAGAGLGAACSSVLIQRCGCCLLLLLLLSRGGDQPVTKGGRHLAVSKRSDQACAGL